MNCLQRVPERTLGAGLWWGSIAHVVTGGEGRKGRGCVWCACCVSECVCVASSVLSPAAHFSMCIFNAEPHQCADCILAS